MKNFQLQKSALRQAHREEMQARERRRWESQPGWFSRTPFGAGRPRRGKPTPKTTSLSRGRSVRNWAKLLLRFGAAE
jgi:hypothetical protein